ncbi:MAG: hypothetical protein FRX49_04675 [Trebouxia sp. A1-2]|nr:MAG: hypothetical protein FRX49_04675 [Trebouxia sp. A1-2]
MADLKESGTPIRPHLRRRFCINSLPTESASEDGNRSGCSAPARDMARSGATQVAAARPSTVTAAQQPQQQCQHSQLQYQSQPDITPSQLAETPVAEAAAAPLSSITCSDHPPADPLHSSATQAASGYQEPASNGMPASGHATQQPTAMPMSSDAVMQDICHNQHDCRQIGAATRTQPGRTAEQAASPPQSQQKAASNVYTTKGPISHQEEAFQPNPVENSQTQNCVNSNQNQQPAQPGPVQLTPQCSVSLAQPEQLQLDSLSREDRLSREKGLDMLQQGSPMSWVAFASELDLKQGLRCRWVGDKIWRECKCGKRRGNGWCCKNQPWEHAFCALVSRVPSLAHPSISSPAGASAPSGVSGPAGSSAPDGVAGPLGRSTRLCGNSAADRSSQQVRAQTRAIEFEHRVTEPELTLTQGLAEWGGRTQMPLSSIQVRCLTEFAFITVRACTADSLRAVASNLRAAVTGFWAAAISSWAVAGGPSASAFSPRAAATSPRAARHNAFPYAAPVTAGFVHRSQVTNTVNVLFTVTATLTLTVTATPARVTSTVALSSFLKILPFLHFTCQEMCESTGHSSPAGVDSNGISIQAKREAALKRLEDSKRRRSLATQLQSHSQTDPQSHSNHSTSPEQASLSQNSSQPPHTQSDTTRESAPLARSGSASASGLGSGSRPTCGSASGSDPGSSLPMQSPVHLSSPSAAQAATQPPAEPSAAMPDWPFAGQQQQQQLSQSGGVWEAEATGRQIIHGRKRGYDAMTAGLFDDKGRSISEKREAAQNRLRASLARRGHQDYLKGYEADTLGLEC